MKKNVTKLLTILLATIMLLSLCACGGESDSNEVEVGKTYDFGKYELVYRSACIMPDDEGADSLVVYFDFTNNSDSAASFGWTVFWTVTQGDEALEPNFVITNLETISYVGETSFTDIEPGTTVEVGNSFKLKNTTDEVKVNISDLLDKYSYNLTFNPAELERVDPRARLTLLRLAARSWMRLATRLALRWIATIPSLAGGLASGTAAGAFAPLPVTTKPLTVPGGIPVP